MLDDCGTASDDHSLQTLSATQTHETHSSTEFAGDSNLGPESVPEGLQNEASQNPGAKESAAGPILRSTVSFILGTARLSEDLNDEALLNSGSCFEMRRRFKRLQRKLASQCRVLVIPCVKSDGAKEGAGPGLK